MTGVGGDLHSGVRIAELPNFNTPDYFADPYATFHRIRDVGVIQPAQRVEQKEPERRQLTERRGVMQWGGADEGAWHVGRCLASDVEQEAEDAHLAAPRRVVQGGGA